MVELPHFEKPEYPKRPKRSSLAEAYDLVSRVLTCVMVMILPGIGGGYLDNHYDTSYMMVAGWIIGPPFGLWQLIKLANSVGQENSDEAGN
jgi:F0F1-type ATP synthase assembly protein I|tara:strand:- start:184 stop:456 length:273 start_codon:yes stop_codon:yes gene_type:complete